MLSALLLRELRATWKYVVIGLALAFVILWYSATTERNIGALETAPGVHPVPWFFAYLLVLVLNQRFFGREWSGKGKRLQARLPAPASRQFLAKLVAALATGFVVTFLLIEGNELLSRLYPGPSLPGHGDFGVATLLTGWALVFGAGLLGGVAFPQGALSLVFGSVLVGLFPLALIEIDDRWFAYHDLPDDHMLVIGPLVALVLGAILAVAGASVFVAGRLHLRRILRAGGIALASTILLALPGIVMGELRLREFDRPRWDDPLWRLSFPSASAEDPDRIVLTMYREGHPFPHLAVIDIRDMASPRVSFFGRAGAVGFLPFSGRTAFMDYEGIPAGRKELDWDRLRPSHFTLDESLERVGLPLDDEPRCSAFVRVWRRGGRVVYGDRSKQELVVADERTREILDRYPFNTWSGYPLHDDHWVHADQWFDDRRLVTGLRLQPLLGGEPERVALDDMAMVNRKDPPRLCAALGAGSEVFYIGADRRHLRAFDLDGRRSRPVLQIPSDWPDLISIDRLGEGRYLKLVAGSSVAERHEALLESTTDVLHAWDLLAHDSVYPWPHRPQVAISPGDRYCQVRSRTVGLEILTLPEGKTVAELRGAFFGEWLDDHRFLHLDHEAGRVGVFDAATGESRIVFELPDSAERGR